MSASYRPTVLYIGNRATAIEGVREIVASQGDPESGEPLAADQVETAPARFQTVSSQKRALHAIRLLPPDIVVVETDSKTESRLRFCKELRTRIPQATLIAVGTQRPRRRSVYHHFLRLPIEARLTRELLDELLVACPTPLLQVGAVSLHLTGRWVNGPTGRQRLTPKQAALLQMLMSHPGQTIDRHTLMQAVWKTSYMGDTRTLDVHMRWLREKIEPVPSAPVYLVTVRGAGFSFSGDGANTLAEEAG